MPVIDGQEIEVGYVLRFQHLDGKTGFLESAVGLVSSINAEREMIEISDYMDDADDYDSALLKTDTLVIVEQGFRVMPELIEAVAKLDGEIFLARQKTTTIRWKLLGLYGMCDSVHDDCICDMREAWESVRRTILRKIFGDFAG